MCNYIFWHARLEDSLKKIVSNDVLINLSLSSYEPEEFLEKYMENSPRFLQFYITSGNMFPEWLFK